VLAEPHNTRAVCDPDRVSVRSPFGLQRFRVRARGSGSDSRQKLQPRERVTGHARANSRGERVWRSNPAPSPCSTLRREMPTSSASSFGVGAGPMLALEYLPRARASSWRRSTRCAGKRISVPRSASVRPIACRNHQTAYVEKRTPRRVSIGGLDQTSVGPPEPRPDSPAHDGHGDARPPRRGRGWTCVRLDGGFAPHGARRVLAMASGPDPVRASTARGSNLLRSLLRHRSTSSLRGRPRRRSPYDRGAVPAAGYRRLPRTQVRGWISIEAVTSSIVDASAPMVCVYT
jgi:hypothetical protein